MDNSEITTVKSSRSPISVRTGFSCWNDWPKSPRTKPHSQRRNWAGSGLFRPYRASRAAISSSVAVSPVAARLAMYVSR